MANTGCWQGEDMDEADSRFPMVYEASPFIKAVLVLAALAIFCGIAIGRQQIDLNSQADLFSLLWLFIIIIFGFGVVLTELRRRLQIFPDHFIYRWALGHFEGKCNEIRGFRRLTSRYYPSRLKFYMKAPSNRSFVVMDVRHSDPFFNGWIAGIPDLDQTEQGDYEVALFENNAFGHTPDARHATIVWNKKIQIALNSLGIIAGVWLFLLPSFTAFLACIITPVISMAVAAVFRRRFTLIGDRTIARLSLAFAFFASCLVLGLVIFIDDTLPDKIFMIEGRPQFKTIALSAAVVGVASWGGILAMDRIMDSSSAQIYHATIVNKYISHGGRGGVHYYLDITKVGPPDMPASLQTNAAFYNTVVVGQSLCLNLHKGALGYRWFDFESCGTKSP